MSFPKSKPPHNIRVLHGWLRDYARQNGVPEGRLKHAVDYAIVVSALDRARASSGPHSRSRAAWRWSYAYDSTRGPRATSTPSSSAPSTVGWMRSTMRSPRAGSDLALRVADADAEDREPAAGNPAMTLFIQVLTNVTPQRQREDPKRDVANYHAAHEAVAEESSPATRPLRSTACAATSTPSPCSSTAMTPQNFAVHGRRIAVETFGFGGAEAYAH